MSEKFICDAICNGNLANLVTIMNIVHVCNTAASQWAELVEHDWRVAALPRMGPRFQFFEPEVE